MLLNLFCWTLTLNFNAEFWMLNFDAELWLSYFFLEFHRFEQLPPHLYQQEGVKVKKVDFLTLFLHHQCCYCYCESQKYFFVFVLRLDSNLPLVQTPSFFFFSPIKSDTPLLSNPSFFLRNSILPLTQSPLFFFPLSNLIHHYYHTHLFFLAKF